MPGGPPSRDERRSDPIARMAIPQDGCPSTWRGSNSLARRGNNAPRISADCPVCTLRYCNGTFSVVTQRQAWDAKYGGLLLNSAGVSRSPVTGSYRGEASGPDYRAESSGTVRSAGGWRARRSFRWASGSPSCAPQAAATRATRSSTRWNCTNTRRVRRGRASSASSPSTPTRFSRPPRWRCRPGVQAASR